MLGMKHRGWIAFSGFTWLLIGMGLIYKGVQYFAFALFESDSLMHRLKGVFGSVEQAAGVLMGVSLLVGFLKGRFVLSKTVARVSSRIASLPLPIRVRDVYSLAYLGLIVGMMGLGLLFRFLSISSDIKGMIDVAVGTALVNGAILYFRIIYGTGSRAQSQ